MTARTRDDTPQGEELPATVLENLRAFFEEGVPFNRVLGMRLARARRGFARIEVPFKPELIGDPLRPALHGGVISTLADTCGGAAVLSAVEPGEKCSTIDVRVDYLRPGRLEPIVAEAEVIRVGGRVAVTSMTVFHEDAKRPIAVAKGVYAIKRVRPSPE